ncbi:type IV pilin protein [Methylotetracoccus oryzae]|uniref:type IV pilin protein n=1 Tax=Methylotetracoccus oryzae TaxID=1919059 RepID=UPI00111B82A6|nr:type IV pilin protein [Methylotetracoccus oryzae]
MNARKSEGYTLIELMIAVAVVGILAGIALPSYQSAVMKTRRSDGQAALMKALAQQEQYFLDNKTYTSSMTNLGYSTDPAPSGEGFYKIKVASGSTALTFTLEAAPQGAQATDRCATLTINQLGVKGKTGAEDIKQCW